MVYENEKIYIEKEASSIPWLKVFAKQKCKEMSECDGATKEEIYEVLDVIEKALIELFQPAKINIASFGNYVPQVHWHIMARFEDDSHFPEPMWGKQQRKGVDHTKDMDRFIKLLQGRLNDR